MNMLYFVALYKSNKQTKNQHTHNITATKIPGNSGAPEG
jgi:hypothetical protein